MEIRLFKIYTGSTQLLGLLHMILQQSNKRLLCLYEDMICRSVWKLFGLEKAVQLRDLSVGKASHFCNVTVPFHLSILPCSAY